MKNDPLKNFDFLDSYRGLAALTVFCHHTGFSLGLGIVYNGGWFGVPAFFQLSSFLLTYRLIVQYKKLQLNEWRSYLKITLRYCIMRFCRIYLTYFIFCVYLVLYEQWILNNKYDLRNRFLALITTLNIQTISSETTGHLWTLPLEVCRLIRKYE